MRLYAESRAVVAWLLGEPDGEEIRGPLAGADEVFTSVLTLVESDRVLIRAEMTEGLKESEVVDRRRVLTKASRRWHLLQLQEEVLERARRPFPGEPIRTVDALHLASALTARAAAPELAVLSLDKHSLMLASDDWLRAHALKDARAESALHYEVTTA